MLKERLFREVEWNPNLEGQVTPKYTKMRELLAQRKKLVISLLFQRPKLEMTTRELLESDGFSRTELTRLLGEMGVLDGIGVIEAKNKTIRINPETIYLVEKEIH